MTVVRSAMGTRLDCDGCDGHAATPSLSIETLRRNTDYVQHNGRDYCPDCQHRRRESLRSTADDEPAAG
jgi:hypothetical protein